MRPVANRPPLTLHMVAAFLRRLRLRLPLRPASSSPFVAGANANDVNIIAAADRINPSHHHYQLHRNQLITLLVRVMRWLITWRQQQRGSVMQEDNAKQN
jgi:hypothetical protein